MLGAILGAGAKIAGGLLGGDKGKQVAGAIGAGLTGGATPASAGGRDTRAMEEMLKLVEREKREKEEQKKNTAVAPVARVHQGVNPAELAAENAERRGWMTGSYTPEPQQVPRGGLLGLLGATRPAASAGDIATPIPEMYGVQQDYQSVIDRQARNAGQIYAVERLGQMTELPDGLDLGQVYNRLYDEGRDMYLSYAQGLGGAPRRQNPTDAEIADQDVLGNRVARPDMLYGDMGLRPGEAVRQPREYGL